MRIMKVLNHLEFEAVGNNDDDFFVGDFIKAGDTVAIIASLSQEEPDYIRYMGELEKEEIEKNMPDIVNPRKIAKCLSLCTMRKEEVRKTPRLGDKLEKLGDTTIRELHYDGELHIPYLIPILRKKDNDISITIIRALILKLIELIPEEKDLLNVILSEIEYSRIKGVEL